MLTSFADLEQMVSEKKEPNTILVAAAHDPHTLRGINKAYLKGMVKPVLIGNGGKIREIIKSEGLAFDGAEIIDTEDDAQSAKKAVELVVSGHGKTIMKGKLHTAALLREVVKKEYGLLSGGIMSHVALMQIPGFSKIVVLTDAGMVIAPSFEQKKQILHNAVTVLDTLGVKNPLVAALCAVETENPKMQASVDAALLKKQNAEGLISGCVVEGPISFDLMYDREIAKIKGYNSPVTGEADILLMPEIIAGNILAKALALTAKAKMAGIIAGAKIPIVLTSRGASAEEKYLSIVFAAAAAQ